MIALLLCRPNSRCFGRRLLCCVALVVHLAAAEPIIQNRS